MRNPKAKLRAECDRLLQEKAIEKYGNHCEICSGTYRIGGHHIFSKSQYGFLRYDLDNIAVLCSACHIIKLHSRADPLILEKIKEKRGLKWWNNLKRKAQKRPSGSYLTLKWYKDQLDQLKRKSPDISIKA